MIDLAEDTSRKPSIQVVLWVLLVTFSKIYKEMQEKKSTKNYIFFPYRNMHRWNSRWRDCRGVCHHCRDTSCFEQDKKTDWLRISQESGKVHLSQAQKWNTVHFHLTRKHLGLYVRRATYKICFSGFILPFSGIQAPRNHCTIVYGDMVKAWARI